MIILSHRGFWRDPTEKNGAIAFERTISEGFGTETDIRDWAGDLVVSHDPPRGGEIGIAQLVHYFQGTGLPLAVNIKADGLAPSVGQALAEIATPWFAFDMSGPETFRYARLNLPFFTRHSDIEPSPILYETAAGIWLDAFESDWFDGSVIARHLDAGKQVCVVSSDLHGRDNTKLWAMLKPLRDRDALMLCTDHPDLAEKELGQ